MVSIFVCLSAVLNVCCRSAQYHRVIGGAACTEDSAGCGVREAAANTRAGTHRGAEDSGGGEAVREDVPRVVPAVVQAQRPQAHHIYLLAAAPFHPPYRSQCIVLLSAQDAPFGYMKQASQFAGTSELTGISLPLERRVRMPTKPWLVEQRRRGCSSTCMVCSASPWRAPSPLFGGLRWSLQGQARPVTV
jgi:hypothetical protein